MIPCLMFVICGFSPDTKECTRIQITGVGTGGPTLIETALVALIETALVAPP